MTDGNSSSGQLNYRFCDRTLIDSIKKILLIIAMFTLSYIVGIIDRHNMMLI